jgi:mono/diheme cytochrome c family protein
MKNRSTFAVLVLFSGTLACNSPQQQEQQEANADTETALSQAQLEQYRQQGRTIAKTSFDTLSYNLMRAMKAGGPLNALQFCNVEAYPLTDSLSAQFNAHIRRTSIQYRNPENRPDAQEQELLSTFAGWKEQGRDLSQADTLVMLDDGQVLFAKPILLQPQCQACHGVPGEALTKELQANIKELYPEDRAIGFRPGDLRGMWAIRFRN